MHKHFKEMGNIELHEEKESGPSLVVTFEYEQDVRHEFYGVVISTTHRLFIRISINENEIESRGVLYQDITGVSEEKLLMLGTVIHFWIGERIGVSLKIVSDGDIDRTLEFLYK